MEQPIEHGVGHGGIREELVPFAGRHLARDQCGVALSPIVDDLKEIVLSLTLKRGDGPVIKDEKVGLGDLGKQLEISAVGPGERQFKAESGQPKVAGSESVPAGLVRESAGEIGLPHPGGAGDDEVVVLP